MRLPGRHHHRALLAAGLLALLPAAGAGQRLGVFFDEQATSCADTIEPNVCGIRRVYIVAFPDGDFQVTGVLLRLELPAELEVCPDPGLLCPGFTRCTWSGDLTAESGLDVQFFPCLPAGESTVIMSFDVWANSRGDDLVLHLAGTPQDSTADHLRPRLKKCNPDDPEGNLGLVDATASDAFLNCTRNCVCTSAIETRTWGAVKTLFQGR